jgi:glutathione synthase
MLILAIKAAASARQRGILIIVQHANFNIGDERPLEYALWDRDIPVYRVEWRSILQNVSLGPNQELLYTSASCPFSPLEISIVYYRAGYHPAEYMDEGVEARLMLETSKAIKCPSILTHLTTFKHIQQELTRPGILNELVSQLQAKRLSATFMPMYALDESESGLHGRELALKEETAHDFILKPSLEGGGNNIYGSDIPEFLTSIAEEAWPNFTLMKKINADTHQALLLSSEKLHKAPTVSELGIIGTCLWRHGDSNEVEILLNEQAGWTFKTKPDSINEMSVVKGYGYAEKLFVYYYDY